MPEPEPSAAALESSLARLYATRFPDAQLAARARLWQLLYDGFFGRYVVADGTVADLGAGYCDFINCVVARRRIAIDLNPHTAERAAPGVEVHAVSLHQLDSVLEPSGVDLAFASNVFEHLRSPDELLGVLASIRRALSTRGRLVILQPNIRAVGGTFYDFVDHTLPLTEKGMIEALQLSGFRVEHCRPRFLPYTTKSRLPQWPWLIRAYLALPPAQRLLGKQMLIVARPVGPPGAVR